MSSKQLLYTAYYIADKIDLASYKSNYPEKLVPAGSRELYYQFTETRFMYILSYGVIVFSDMERSEALEHIAKVTTFTFLLRESFREDELKVNLSSEDDHMELTFDDLKIGRFDHAVNKMIMMHLAQSVALDHFNGLSQGILSEVKSYTTYMQTYGKVKLGHKQALKFIGKSLNAKNSIAENLYILDSPETAWEDEYLNRLHMALLRHFELTQRNKEIDNTLRIIEDNLTVYISYNHHRESSRLEWIIIILIVIEVIDTFASKLL
ncbi:MAG: RMD1 family protein [Marinoscillum sp.]